MNTQGTSIDLEKADAILLLDAPRWESPDVCNTSRASFSYALILAVPVALILAGFAFLARLTPDLPTVSTLVLGR